MSQQMNETKELFMTPFIIPSTILSQSSKTY